MANRTYRTASASGRRLFAPALMVLLVGASLLTGPASVARKRKPEPKPPPKSWVHTKWLARGVKHVEIKNVEVPYRINIVSIRLDAPSTIDTVLANDSLPGLETTSSMAHRSHALVAINGDYARSSGRPVFTFANDGSLGQTPLSWGRNFAVNKAETSTFVGHPNVRSWMTDKTNGFNYLFDRVNAGAPGADELALFTPVGGGEEMPPQGACSVRLFRDTPIRVLQTDGVAADYHVDEVYCGEKRLWPEGGVVVSTPAEGKRVTELTSLVPGQVLELGWSLGWKGVVDTIGGNPTMIENGQIIEGNVIGTSPFLSRHPRTAVAVTDDGHVLFVTVDGRRSGYSIGMTLERLARFLKNRGAVWALNLDGGGSTTMVIDGAIVNRPSDDHERAVSSALVLLRGGDRGETGVEGGGLTSASASEWSSIVSDPASTGGLADALLREGRRLPPSLRRIAEEFRSRRYAPAHTPR